MKFDPIVFNALKKEQADLAGAILPDLASKKEFNSVPVDGRVVDLNDYPSIKNKMRWDYSGDTYGFDILLPGLATRTDRNAIPYYHGMDFNPDDGYIYFVAMATVYRIHQDKIGMVSAEIIHESTVANNTSGEYYACKYIGQDLLLVSSGIKGTANILLQLFNVKTMTSTSTSIGFHLWFNLYKLGAVLFNNRIFMVQGQTTTDTYPTKTQRLKSCAIDLTGFTDHLVGLVGISVHVIGTKLFIAGYENSEAGDLVVYSSLNGTTFTKVGSLTANHHKAVAGLISALHPHMTIGNSIVFGLYRSVYEFNTVTNKFTLIYDASLFMQGDTYVRILGNLHIEQKLLLSFTSFGTEDLKTFRTSSVFAFDYKLTESNTLNFGKLRKLYRLAGYSHYGVLETTNGTIVKNNIATSLIHITRPRRKTLSNAKPFGNKQLEYRMITDVNGSN